MTIINAKSAEVNEEAGQSIAHSGEEEYAAGRDNFWTQSPPAYEEATSREYDDEFNRHFLPSETPHWTEMEKAPQKRWRSPHIPHYTCSATFSISSNCPTIVRAYGTGYTGWLRIGSSCELQEDAWKSMLGNCGKDRIGIIIQAKFTHTDLLEMVKLNKVREERDCQIVGEGISLKSEDMETRADRFLQLTIIIYLPEPIYRTSAGLAKDGTSQIPILDIFTDNLQIIFDGSNPASRLSFSKIIANARLSGITVRMNLMANDSINLLSSIGEISDFLSPTSSIPTISAPKISVLSENGSIRLSTIVALDEIDLSSFSGSINITQLVIAKKVSCTSREGSIRGQFSAFDNLSIKTTTAMVDICVIACKNIYKEYLGKCGLLALLDTIREQEILADLESSETFWRRMKVSVFTHIGSLSLKFRDQDIETQLISEVTSLTGSVNILHANAFYGQVEFQTMVGPIAIHDDDDEMQQKGKTFEIQLGHSEQKKGRYLLSRIFPSSHGWDAVGPDRKHAFPLSNSCVYSNLGRIESSFT